MWWLVDARQTCTVFLADICIFIFYKLSVLSVFYIYNTYMGAPGHVYWTGVDL